STWQAIEATRARDRALSLAARNQAVVGFLTSMLTEVVPAEQSVKVSDLIERAQQMLLNEDDIPEHRAAILHMLSAYYLSSGKPAQADEMLKTSIELTKNTDDQDLRVMLQCESAYAASLLGRIDEATELIAKGLEASAGTSSAIQCHRNRAYIAQNT